jgi:membrane-bound inhibitor of C-type lysozyme
MRDMLKPLVTFFAGFFVLAGCSSINVNVWPFDGDKAPARAGMKGPDNATEYRCEGGKLFHVRQLEAGKAVWLFLPDRQVRLDKNGSEGDASYTNGIATLKLSGSEATLIDGPSANYSGCKATGGR